jgi:hypothetical protein
VAKIFERIDEHLREWIAEREMFFVASAPLDAEGHVNVSPKGPAGTLRVLDEHTVAYLDMVGSEVIPADDPRFAELFERAGFEAPHEVSEAQRAIVLVDVTRVADSCGYGVPLMSYEGERPHMEAWAEKKMRVGGKAEIESYVAAKNAESIDGLPAFDTEGEPAEA